MDELENFDEMDDGDELNEWDTLSLIDDDGNEILLSVIDAIEYNNCTYMLVIDDEELEDEEEEDAVSIIKQVGEDGENIMYEFLDDDDEIKKVLELFQSSSDDFEIIS